MTTTRKPPTQRPAMPQNGVKDEPEESQEDFDARMRVISREIEEGERELKAIKSELWANGWRLLAHLSVLIALLLVLVLLVGSQLAMVLAFCVAVMWVAQYGIMVIKNKQKDKS